MAKYLAPAYGLLEGFVVGGLSAFLNESFAEKFPNLISTAVGLTFGVAFAMFLLYNFRIIKPTQQRFKSIILSSIMGIMIFYAMTWVLALFGVHLEFLSLTNGSALGIGISIFVTAIAALTLIT